MSWGGTGGGWSSGARRRRRWRAPAFTPEAYGTVRVWLDANESVSPGTDGDGVESWTSTVGGIAVTQGAGAAFEPVYDADDAELRPGNASINIDDAAQQDLRNTSLSLSDAAYTLFWFAKPEATGASDWLLSYGTGGAGSNEELSVYKPSSEVIQIRCDNGVATAVEGSDLDGEFHLYSATVATGAQKVWRDGSAAWSTNDTSALTLGTIDRLIIGKRNSLVSGGPSDLALHGLFAGALSDANRQAIEKHLIRRYINQHYGSTNANDGTTGDVFIVFGQSNALASDNQGGGKNVVDPRLTHPGLVTWHVSNAEWVRGDADGGGMGSGQVGQWFAAFARKALDNGDATTIAHLGLPVGGVSITTILKGGSTYDNTLAQVAASGVDTSDATVPIWIGETDTIDGMSEATFRGHLDTWLADVLSDYGAGVQVIAIQDSVGYGANIIAAYASWAAANPSTVTLLDISGYDSASLDSLHYPYAGGYREIGRDEVYPAVYP